MAMYLRSGRSMAGGEHVLPSFGFHSGRGVLLPTWIHTVDVVSRIERQLRCWMAGWRAGERDRERRDDDDEK